MNLAATRLLLRLALASAGLGAGWARASAQELAATSPFLPPAGAPAGPITENAPLELRGIMGADSGRLFNIYDPSSKLSYWVSLNEAGHNFTVRSYDETSDTVSLDYAGRPLSLRLTEAKITPLAVAPAPAARGNLHTPGDNPGDAAIPAPGQLTAEQARRLENVAAEVARRRALRSAAQAGARPGAAPNQAPNQR